MKVLEIAKISLFGRFKRKKLTQTHLNDFNAFLWYLQCYFEWLLLSWSFNDVRECRQENSLASKFSSFLCTKEKNVIRSFLNVFLQRQSHDYCRLCLIWVFNVDDDDDAHVLELHDLKITEEVWWMMRLRLFFLVSWSFSNTND